MIFYKSLSQGGRGKQNNFGDRVSEPLARSCSSGKVFFFCFVLIVLCFSFRGPKEIVTLEYGAFESGHPLWSFLRLQPWINIICENDVDFDSHFDVTIKKKYLQAK